VSRKPVKPPHPKTPNAAATAAAALAAARNALDRAFFEMMACTLESEIVGVPESAQRQERVTEVLRILSKYA